MSATSSSSISSTAVRVSQFCDQVPGLSTVNSLINIFQKSVISCFCSSESVNKNYYFSYIKNKSIFRCIVLAIPVIGNIIVAVYDRVYAFRNACFILDLAYYCSKGMFIPLEIIPGNDINQALLSTVESALGTKFERPPPITPEDLVLQSFLKIKPEKLQAATSVILKALDKKIAALQSFNEIIVNPDKELVLYGHGIMPMYHNENGEKKLNYLSTLFKLSFLSSHLRESVLVIQLSDLLPQEIVQQKLHKISQLEKQFLERRQSSYKTYIETVTDETLLIETGNYYLESLSKEEGESIRASGEQATFETILPKLEKQVSAQSKETNFLVIEMQEIILQIQKRRQLT